MQTLLKVLQGYRSELQADVQTRSHRLLDASIPFEARAQESQLAQFRCESQKLAGDLQLLAGEPR